MPLDIGPFADQADLLRFAMLLETIPGVGQIDLMDTDLHTALFVVRALSPNALRAAVLQVPDYRIAASVTGNAVSARITTQTRAVQLLARSERGLQAVRPATYVYHSTRPLWWRRAMIAVALSAAATSLAFFAYVGRPQAPSSVAITTPVPVATATATPVAAFPSPTAATPAPTQTATPIPTVSPSPAPIVVPVPAAPQQFVGTFSGTFGLLTAVNGCQWDTPFTADLAMRLTPNADGTRQGSATLTGRMSYVVTNTPTGATCNPSTVAIEAAGSASGNNPQITASLSGQRNLVVTFIGSGSSALTGDVALRRLLSTVSTFGNTDETRSASIPGITLSRSN